MKKRIIKEWHFTSLIDDRIYETLQYDDGSMSCNCMGWCRRVAADGSRSCRHTRQVEARKKKFDPKNPRNMKKGDSILLVDRYGVCYGVGKWMGPVPSNVKNLPLNPKTGMPKKLKPCICACCGC